MRKDIGTKKSLSLGINNATVHCLLHQRTRNSPLLLYVMRYDEEYELISEYKMVNYSDY